MIDYDARQLGAGLGRLSRWLFYRNAITDFSTHSPLYLLKAIRALLDERPELSDRIELTFAGTFGQRNLELVRELGLDDCVSALGYLPHSESIRNLVESDILFFPLMSRTDGQRSYIHAGKLFEYLAAEKPLLAAVPEGDARDLIERAGAGWCVDPYDVDAIKQLLLELIDKKAAGDFGLEPDREYIMRYRRRELTRQLAELFDGLLSR